MFDTQNNAFRKLFEEGKKYINLQIDYAKLTATEKISVILGMSVILFKKKLILVPITRFISKVLLDNEKTPL